MHGLLALLTLVAVTFADEVHPIWILPEHTTIVWTVTLHDEATCHVKAWIGRMGEQPLATVFVVDLDETVALSAEGETPLHGLEPGSYDLHVENVGCTYTFSLAPG